MKILVINSGSSSIKYEVFDESLDSLASGLLERIGEQSGRITHRQDHTESVFERTVKDHHEGLSYVIEICKETGVLDNVEEIAGIGHRVVHGGERFTSPTLIDEEVLKAIRQMIPLAPLHNPANLQGIEVALKLFKGVPQVAVFDTAFHQTMPAHAYRYAIPDDYYAGHGIRRYGFHGTSHQYVAERAAEHLGKPLAGLNMITLHLGNGASAAAIRRGECVDTSMGMTPLEGLVMGTRSGDIDPAVHFYLMRELEMGPEEVEALLYRNSGLRGLCGTNDMREVQRRASGGDESASLALEIYCYRIKKYIGAYSAVLGWLDALVFTGGIGENSAEVRERSCEGLDALGIELDEAQNRLASGDAADIQSKEGRVKVLVVRTDEERLIARQVIKVIRAS